MCMAKTRRAASLDRGLPVEPVQHPARSAHPEQRSRAPGGRRQQVERRVAADGLQLRPRRPHRHPVPLHRGDRRGLGPHEPQHDGHLHARPARRAHAAAGDRGGGELVSAVRLRPQRPTATMPTARSAVPTSTRPAPRRRPSATSTTSRRTTRSTGSRAPTTRAGAGRRGPARWPMTWRGSPTKQRQPDGAAALPGDRDAGRQPHLHARRQQQPPDESRRLGWG